MHLKCSVKIVHNANRIGTLAQAEPFPLKWAKVDCRKYRMDMLLCFKKDLFVCLFDRCREINHFYVKSKQIFWCLWYCDIYICILIINIQWSLVNWILIIRFSAHCFRFMCSEEPHLHPKSMTSQACNMEKSVVLLLEASQTCRWCCFGFCTECSRAPYFLGDHAHLLHQAVLGSAHLVHQRSLQKYISWGMWVLPRKTAGFGEGVLSLFKGTLAARRISMRWDEKKARDSLCASQWVALH